MCQTHTHGPNAIATAPQHISAQQYLETSKPFLPQTTQTTLQQVLQLQPLSDSERNVFNNITSKEGKIVFLADRTSAFFTDRASQAYAQGDIATGNALMEEMKLVIAKIQNGV